MKQAINSRVFSTAGKVGVMENKKGLAIQDLLHPSPIVSAELFSVESGFEQASESPRTEEISISEQQLSPFLSIETIRNNRNFLWAYETSNLVVESSAQRKRVADQASRTTYTNEYTNSNLYSQRNGIFQSPKNVRSLRYSNTNYLLNPALPENQSGDNLVVGKLHNYASDNGPLANSLVTINTVSRNRFQIPLREDASDVRKVKKVAQYFLEWKIDLRWYFNDPISPLTQTFKLDLSKLEHGQYSLGNMHECELKVHGSPSCPDIIGVIVSEGRTGKKFLHLRQGLNGAGNPISLEPGWFHDLDETIKLEVNSDNHFRIYDLTSAAYKKVTCGPPNLFFPYNSNIVFFGKPVSEFHLEVSFYGIDVIFEMDYDAKRRRSVVYYTDDVSSAQRIYPARAVDLVIVSPTLYIMNFNFSYPSNIYHSDQLEINCIDIPMYGGVNPFYF
ncbi:hypothetical protein HDV06_002200 [Boothiomyces sp. JEL0866]|nr:hypothetical protein HDV06_002200 [Boothiomyces sp. JEL0866]